MLRARRLPVQVDVSSLDVALVDVGAVFDADRVVNRPPAATLLLG